MHHDDEQLSQAALAELESDHLNDNPPDEDVVIDFRVFAEPASVATTLGSAVVENAVKYLQIPLREDAGVNQDSTGFIRTFFMQGVKWNADMWDHWIEKHPQSVVSKPEWCAAFGSYCVRMAYDKARKPIPVRLSASSSELHDRHAAAGRFLSREALFHDDGPIREDATALPGPGDLVIFHGHTAVLRELYADGSYTTIEGNTYKGHPRKDGVYQCSRSSTQKRADGTFKLVGFCLLPSIDGLVAGPTAVLPQDEPEPPPSSEQVAEPEPPPSE